MNWFWVHFKECGYDGWCTEFWELVAANDEDHIRATWSGPNVAATVQDIIPFAEVRIPRTPRKTVHPRTFNPRSPR